MDYEYAGYQEADLVKMDILIHGEPVEAFSSILHRSKRRRRAPDVPDPQELISRRSCSRWPSRPR